MKRLATLIVAAGLNLAGGGLFAQEQASERQPGVLRFAGLKDTDRVLIDDEVVGTGQRLSKFRYEVLVAAGDYRITVINKDNEEACSVEVNVPENATVNAGCTARQSAPKLVAQR